MHREKSRCIIKKKSKTNALLDIFIRGTDGLKAVPLIKMSDRVEQNIFYGEVNS